MVNGFKSKFFKVIHMYPGSRVHNLCTSVFTITFMLCSNKSGVWIPYLQSKEYRPEVNLLMAPHSIHCQSKSGTWWVVVIFVLIFTELFIVVLVEYLIQTNVSHSNLIVSLRSYLNFLYQSHQHNFSWCNLIWIKALDEPNLVTPHTSQR